MSEKFPMVDPMKYFDEVIEANQLLKIAALHSTDKNQHGYIPYYSLHMPESISSMLEIGCLQGSSLAMWREYYGWIEPPTEEEIMRQAETETDLTGYKPRIQIHTMDLFLDPDHISQDQARSRGFITHAGDQGDTKFLKTIKDQFDVIIDDGSHNSHHQQITFKQMFINNLKSGGLYVIEDLHCCKDPFYWTDKVKGFGDTMLFALKDFLENKRLMNAYFINAGYISTKIESVNIYDDKIAFIRKK